MNREEQIRKAFMESPIGTLDYESFREGARWADAHPKEDGVEMWAARNRVAKYLFLSYSEPKYDAISDEWYNEAGELSTLPSESVFSEVTFENSPMKVRLTLVKE